MRAGGGYSSNMATSAPQTARPATDKPPRPRRWIPLSLRIFAVMLVLLRPAAHSRLACPRIGNWRDPRN